MRPYHRTAIRSFSLMVIIALTLSLTLAGSSPMIAFADPGDLDPTFGDDGKVITPLGQRPLWALDTVVLPNGKVVVIGAYDLPNYDTVGLVLARYNADGLLDRDFGNHGMTRLGNALNATSGEAIALQPDGKVVVAGWAGAFDARDVFLARFASDGSLDRSFGIDGLVMTDVVGPWDESNALAIQSDGRIVVVGSSASIERASDVAIIRYHIDGSLDAGFGDNGKVILNLGSSEDHGNDIAIQVDSKLVIAGSAGGGLTLVRLLPDGSLDASFASQGVFAQDVGFAGNALKIQADGKVVVAGAGSTSSNGSILGLARVQSDGSLDLGFGNQGIVTTEFTPGGDRWDALDADVIIQADGRIVAGGSTGSADNRDFAVARYHPDGSLDSTFGASGLVTTDFAGKYDSGHALSLQSDGKIVIAGNTVTFRYIYHSDFALARYNADGSLDAEFGTEGQVTSNFELGRSSARQIAVQHDGKIVVAGSTTRSWQTSSDFAVIRYNKNGSLDPSFGDNGIVITDFDKDSDWAAGLALQSDGKIVAAGTAKIGGAYRFAVARYLRNGALDSTFGNDGKVAIPFADGSARGAAVVLQADDRIVVAGNTYGYTLARYNPDGSLDTSFGNGGTTTIDIGGDGAWQGASDLEMQSDGKFVVAGTDNLNFALARFNSDGSLDGSFGQDGTLITDFGGNDWCNGVAIQADGKIIAAGDTENGWVFALARYNLDGSLDPTFGNGGIVTTNPGSMARGYGVMIQPSGQILVSGYVWPPLGVGGGFGLVRYQSDGALDETFGTHGVVTTDFSETIDAGAAIGLQPNGKIVVAGWAADTFALARFEGWDVLPTYLPVIMRTSESHAGVRKEG